MKRKKTLFFFLTRTELSYFWRIRSDWKLLYAAVYTATLNSLQYSNLVHKYNQPNRTETLRKLNNTLMTVIMVLVWRRYQEQKKKKQPNIQLFNGVQFDRWFFTFCANSSLKIPSTKEMNSNKMNWTKNETN